MKCVVLDTSALLRLYVPDGPVPPGAEEALEAAWRAEAVVFVPDLALVEAAQVLHKKVLRHALTAAEADETLAAILDLPLEVAGHRALLTEAVELARAHRLTVYDALFLALARAEKATLVSADDRLATAWARSRP